MGVKNYKYLHPKYILSNLARKFKSKQIQMGDIIEWCAFAETNHIKDIGSMISFQGIGIEISGGVAKLPCNIFRIEDIYDEDERHLYVSNNGEYLSNIKDEHGTSLDDGDYVYLNYAGIPVDDEGVPLVTAGHEIACETFCKINLFEEDALFGKIDRNIFIQWKAEFSGQVLAARNSFRFQTRKDVEYMALPLLNMIPKIADLPIKQKMDKDWA